MFATSTIPDSSILRYTPANQELHPQYFASYSPTGDIVSQIAPFQKRYRTIDHWVSSLPPGGTLEYAKLGEYRYTAEFTTIDELDHSEELRENDCVIIYHTPHMCPYEKIYGERGCGVCDKYCDNATVVYQALSTGSTITQIAPSYQEYSSLEYWYQSLLGFDDGGAEVEHNVRGKWIQVSRS